MEKILILLLLIATIVIIIQKKIDIKKQKIIESMQQYNANINAYQTENFFPYRMKYLLTQNEYNFYSNLKEITRPLNLQILAKIRLADLIEVDTNRINKTEYMKYFSKIKSKHIDFAICNEMNIVALLELDDRSHQRQDRMERDYFVNSALLNAGYTVIRTNGNLDIIKQALYDRGYNVYQNQDIK